MKKTKKSKEKLFVVRQYVMAKNAIEAIKKARRQYADDVWVDDEWKKGNAENLADAIGFEIEEKNERG
jgi:hypothetical protein